MRFGVVEYADTAAARGWGPGWPTDRSADMSSFSVTTTLVGDAAGSSKQAGVGTQSFTVNKGIAALTQIILNEVQRRGYPLVAGWCWSYEDRAISGTNTPSNHSWGLAIDLNAPDNPYTQPQVTDMPSWLPALFASYGFAWGGNYTGDTDSMHYEFMGTPAQAVQALAAARSELGGSSSVPANGGTTTTDWFDNVDAAGLQAELKKAFPAAGGLTDNVGRRAMQFDGANYLDYINKRLTSMTAVSTDAFHHIALQNDANADKIDSSTALLRGAIAELTTAVTALSAAVTASKGS